MPLRLVLSLIRTQQLLPLAIPVAPTTDAVLLAERVRTFMFVGAVVSLVRVQQSPVVLQQKLQQLARLILR